MPDPELDISHDVFTKTAVGQQEIQSRALKLGPVPRRLLILIDGKRSTQELASFVAGNDIALLIGELIEKGCIESVFAQPAPAPVSTSEPPPILAFAASSTAVAAILAPTDAFLSQLPDASTRNQKDLEAARSFMMNTVNTVFQPNTRLTLLEAIFSCKTVEQMRAVYPKWAETINSSSIGVKCMPEFLPKLAQVL